LGRAEAQKKDAVKNENFVKYNSTRMLKKVIDDSKSLCDVVQSNPDVPIKAALGG